MERSKLLNNVELLIKKYQSGIGLKKLEKEFSCSEKTIKKILIKNNIDLRKQTENWGKIKNFEQDIISMYKRGYSCRKISRILKLDNKTISNKVKELDLIVDPIKINNRLSEIIELYENGLSCIEIYNKFNNKLKINNLNRPNNGKYLVNEDFFNIINNEEKAYYLGMWYADGNVMNTNFVKCIRLQMTDKEILDICKYVMNYNGPIRIRKVGNNKPIYTLQIHRPKLVNSLINKGCIPRKSLVINFPNNDIVPDYLISHFIRGWFDGDGSISYNKINKQWVIGLIGTKELIEGILNISNTKAYLYKRNKNTKINTWCASITKQEEVEKFINLIYQNASIFLPRKAIKANQCINKIHNRKIFIKEYI